MPFKPEQQYDYNDLLACGRGELFGPGNAQLPLPPMLMFDRITHVDESNGQYSKGSIVAELDINAKLWFFDCHFQGDPVMPGCLGLAISINYVPLRLRLPAPPGRLLRVS